MPTTQLNRIPPKSGPKTPPVKSVNKAEIAKVFDNKGPSVKQRILQWQDDGGGVKTTSGTSNDVSPVTKSEQIATANATNPDQQESNLPREDPIESSDVNDSSHQIANKEAVTDVEGNTQQEARQLRQKLASKPKPSTTRKRQISATRIRIAQAIIGPTVRPSERQRRLSEAKREKDVLAGRAIITGEAQVAQSSELRHDADTREKTGKKENEDKLQRLPRPVGKKIEVATPKKRIVSDGHWRKPRSPAIAFNTSIPPCQENGSMDQETEKGPAVERWLNFIPSELHRPTSKGKDRTTPRTNDPDSEHEHGYNEHLQREGNGIITPNGVNESTTSEASVAPPTRDDTQGLERFTTVKSIRSEKSLSENETSSKTPIRKANQSVKPCSAPSSVFKTEKQATGTSYNSHSNNHRSLPDSAESCGSTASDSEYSDHLTSISRRPPPKKIPGQRKRKIFSHAAKLFTRPDSKLDSGKVVPPAPVRVPTIESWLDRMQDPFIDNRNASLTDVTSHSQTRLDDAIIQDERSKNNDSSTFENCAAKVVVQGSDNATKPEVTNGWEVPKMTAGEDPGKSKRTRRVLRHRNGTVTFEDPGVSHELEPSSPHLRRRKANRHPRSDPVEYSKQSLPIWERTSTLPCTQGGERPQIDSREQTQQSDDSKSTDYNGSLLKSERETRVKKFKVNPLTRDLDNRDELWSASQEKLGTKTVRQVSRARKMATMGERSTTGKSHRLAKHSDLISVLSHPRGSGSSIRSARSVRTHRSRLATATSGGLMEEFVMDESKYMRELYTLVDGVIPVLLSSILSRTNAAAAAGLFNPNANIKDAESFSKPIFEMGLALEKLKVHHEKAPRDSIDGIVPWAEQMAPLYTKYLRSWRMGFQDVVVNLANKESSDDEAQNERGLPLNADGDVIDGNGERVDVAYLLKRPLVRLKYVSKTLRGIHYLTSSERCLNAHTTFAGMVDEAKQRAQAEQARLEDEAAAVLDSTKARDPSSLDSVEGVMIQQDMRVKARDTFDLQLNHSSGQKLDCRAELYLREDLQRPASRSDLLIAEVDGTGRWLLFPPINASNISARNGDCKGEFIIMIRGEDKGGLSWYEVISLFCEEEQTGFEWVQMLGLHPTPPAVEHHEQQKSLARANALRIESLKHDKSTFGSSPKSDLSDIVQVQVPIGERPPGQIRRWQGTTGTRMWKRLSRHSPSTIFEETTAALADGDMDNLDTACHALQISDNTTALTESCSIVKSKSSRKHEAKPRQNNLENSIDPVIEVHQTSVGGVQHGDVNFSPSKSSSYIKEAEKGSASHASDESNSQDGSPNTTTKCPQGAGTSKSEKVSRVTPARYHAKKSLTSLPQPQQASRASPDNSSSASKGADRCSITAQATKLTHLSTKSTSNIEIVQMSNSRPVVVSAQSSELAIAHPDQIKALKLRQPEPSQGHRRLHRRTSSPLKHEYEPSSASDSTDDSEVSIGNLEQSSTSDSSESDLDGGDAHSILVPMSAVRRYRKAPRTANPGLVDDGTLSPSQSASQAPYREVPNQPGKEKCAFASISFWSDQGCWESLCRNDCLIVVSPGLIEAYVTNDRHQDGYGVKETATRNLMLGLELTPLVPIRRGTALDISIRSPPTPDSKISMKSNNNFLFRSRGPEECEALYTLIHQARINNPTYIALQNARAMSCTANFWEYDRRSSTRSGKSLSWFGLGRKGSYRASSATPPSVSRHTESSVGSLSSAFSAFRNFGRMNGRFNLAKSTVSSRFGNGSTNLHSSSVDTRNCSNSGITHLQNTTNALGLSNCKIRLYIRETNNKWADLGSARLAIMKPSSPANVAVSNMLDSALATSVEHASSEIIAGHGVGMVSSAAYASPGNKITASDKRIVVTASPSSLALTEETPRYLLDVTLGETCFERVARTGIAVSVWENFEGGMVAKKGGVVGGRLRVYMMQFKNEADTAYTYSIVGKLRY